MINPTETIRCPRCGYDQRGVVATWTEQCPLEGVCAECGLRFRWADVLDPKRFAPQWCVEFAPRVTNVPSACARTFLQSFRPWAFWSGLKMSHPIRWNRIAAYIAFQIVPLLLTYAIIQASVAVYVRYQLQQQIAAQQKMLPGYIAQIQRALAQQPSDQSGFTFGQNSRQQMQTQLASMQAMLASPPSLPVSYARAILEAVFIPLAKRSGGRGYASLPYIPPSQLWSYAINLNSMQTGAGVRTISLGQYSTNLVWLGYNCALFVLLPLSFILLPMSRKRAKVRWGHVGRACAYSCFIPVTIIALCLLCTVAGMLWIGFAPVTDHGTRLLCQYGWIMLAIWWAAALHWYMKIPHAIFTVLVLMLLCALVLLGGLWLAFPEWTMSMAWFVDGWL